MSAQIFDDTLCDLGEGPLWHPLRQDLFWFDITASRLFMRGANGVQTWQFDEMYSAAGWVDDTTLMLASETGLWRFDIPTGTRSQICPLEAENPVTRSNDGRADPQGGFWIGTMGKNAEHGAGAIWRWYRGELRQLFPNITISNAISFAPGGQMACFCDTVTGKVMRVGLDAEGWPVGAPEVFVDLTDDKLNPDGAVFDQDGMLWIAQWGASRVAGYAPDGRCTGSYAIPAPHASCPAFGGSDLSSLFVTSARQGLDATELGSVPDSGKTFRIETTLSGQAEHRVIL